MYIQCSEYLKQVKLEAINILTNVKLFRTINNEHLKQIRATDQLNHLLNAYQNQLQRHFESTVIRNLNCVKESARSANVNKIIPVWQLYSWPSI